MTRTVSGTSDANNVPVAVLFKGAMDTRLSMPLMRQMTFATIPTGFHRLGSLPRFMVTRSSPTMKAVSRS